MIAHRYAALFILAWFAISHESDATVFAKKFKRSIINPKDVSNLQPRRLVIKCCASGNSYDDLIDHPVDNGSGASITAEYESERNPSDSTVSPQASLIRDIRSIAIPALAACIVEPALSLVDTYYVGKIAATATMGLAGMSINSALFNIIAAATAPLGTGTTAVISRIRGEEEKQRMKMLDSRMNSSSVVPQETEIDVGQAFLNGIILAFTGGTILSSLSFLFGKSLVSKVFQVKDGLLKATVTYLHIRGLSLPSVLLNYIVFGFSIAMQDSVAPVLSIVTAFLVNVIGDFILCGKMGYGLSGAAIATTLSSYLGSAVALNHLFKQYRIKIPRNTEKDEKSMQGVRSGSVAWGKLFNRRSIAMFFTASGPLLIGALVNTMTYSAGARIASFTMDPKLSTIDVAAHQIVMQSWWFLSYFSSPFSLVAQAVIPKDIAKKDTKRAKAMAALLLRLTCIVGLFVSALNLLLISRFPGTFTKNVDIQKIVQTVLMPSTISLFIICMSTVSDGIFIGSGAIQDFLTASVLSTTAAWSYYAFSIKQKIGLTGAWNGLLIFSIVRMTYYLMRFPTLWLSLGGNKNATA